MDEQKNLTEQSQPLPQPRPYMPPPAPVVQPYPAGKRELGFGAAVLLSCILLWDFILYGGFNLGYALGSIAVMACSVWYLLRCGYTLTWYSGALLALSAVISAGFARADDGFVKFVMVLFQLFAVNLSLSLISGQNLRPPGGIGSVLDAPRVFFKLGFGSMEAASKGLKEARKNAGAAGKKGTAALAGLAIAVPLVAVMIFLLMRADAAFEGLMDLLPETNWSEPLWAVLCGGAAAFLLYSRGVGLHNALKDAPGKSGFRGFSPITLGTVLGAVCLVYGVYLLSQLAYLAGGLSGILPEEYTMAEYARRGFFEMAWLSAINLSVICLSVGLVEKQEKAPLVIRLLCLFIGLVTLFLIATASAKMFMYIGSYGLTRLRVLTEVIMVFMAITTVLVGSWLFREKLPYMKAVVITAMVLGAAVLWVDVDTLVARYNVRSYQSGQLETVDMRHLSGLGYGAVPYIEELVDDSDPEVAEIARDILTYQYYVAEPEDFRGWNWAAGEAAEILSGYSGERETVEIVE